MKTTINKIIGMTGIVIALCLAISASAFADPVGVNDPAAGYCTVKVNYWDHDTDGNGISLLTAAYFSNNPQYNACQTSIILASDVRMFSPLIIQRPGLIFDGRDFTLNVGDFDSQFTDGIDGGKCAIVIDADNVTIKNVKISGRAVAGREMTGICLKRANAKVTNVDVTNTTIGVSFEDSASSSRIYPDNTISAVSTGVGIEDKSGQNSTNIIVMTNEARKAGAPVDQQTGLVNFDSTYYKIEDMLNDAFSSGNPAFSPAATNPLSQLKLGGGKLLQSTAKMVAPLITEIKPQITSTTTRYQIRGIFKSLTAAAQEARNVDCNGAVEASVAQLAIYAVKNAQWTFVGIVGTRYGSYGVKDGTFNFFVDPSKPGLADIESFVLVPIGLDWSLKGRASNFNSLPGQSDCQAGTGPQETTTDSGSFPIYDSMDACNRDNNWGAGAGGDRDRDSDGDGIPDFIERSVVRVKDATFTNNGTDDTSHKDVWVFDTNKGDCSDVGKMSLWNKIDSDDDGIIDSKDGYPQDYLRLRDLTCDSTPSTTNGPPTKLSVDCIVADISAVDASGAALATKTNVSFKDNSKARDDDNDGDGWRDGIEDRSRLFNTRADAYYYIIGGTVPQPYPNKNGEPVKCDLNNRIYGERAAEIGVGYSLFIIGGDGENYLENPKPYSMWGSRPVLLAGQKIKTLKCLNDSVRVDNNFNGVHDQGEMDANDPDTDGDCVCDGNGAGCSVIKNDDNPYVTGQKCLDPTVNHPELLNDGCPETKYPTNQCKWDNCVEGETLEYVKYHTPAGKVYVDGESRSSYVLKKDDTGVEVLFTELVDDPFHPGKKRPNWTLIQSVCSDLDADGIPDCVERPDGKCTPSDKPVLNPYKKDTDDDTVNDVHDVCPMTKPDSCDPRKVYTEGGVPRVLSCFLDRDSDQLRDCEEDLDMDGKVKPAMVVDFKIPSEVQKSILDAESDPLDADTDKDDINDYDELTAAMGIRTNPNRADTDNDTINDKVEHRDDTNSRFTIQMFEGQGCKIALLHDTNPVLWDTDTDGLGDGEEINGLVANPSVMELAAFKVMLQDDVQLNAGIPAGSSPLALNSDKDSVPDNVEYHGSVITYQDSNPCLDDSDDDHIKDNEELAGCSLNSNVSCKSSADNKMAGKDSDGDGLSDACEMNLGTNPKEKDTDNDNILDGEEIPPEANCTYRPNIDTNPGVGVKVNGVWTWSDEEMLKAKDTDQDGLSDGIEVKIGHTKPLNHDTDGDGIPDGPSWTTNPQTGEKIWSAGEDANANGIVDANETNPNDPDTDKDGLPDGWDRSKGMGEDINTNGIRDKDAAGNWIETNPLSDHSNPLGAGDLAEMTYDGRWSQGNITRATTGVSGGCSMVPGTDGTSTGIIYFLGALMLAVARSMAMRMRRKGTPA